MRRVFLRFLLGYHPAPVSATSKQDQPILLEVKNLKTWFPIRRGILQRTVGHVKAVDDVSFFVRRGETLGLVGESGCGKTTVGRTILRLIPNSGGSVRFDGRDVLSAGALDLRRLRREMQIIFQDPGGSLNPRMRVGRIIGEPLEVHGLTKSADETRVRVDVDSEIDAIAAERLARRTRAIER